MFMLKQVNNWENVLIYDAEIVISLGGIRLSMAMARCESTVISW